MTHSTVAPLLATARVVLTVLALPSLVGCLAADASSSRGAFGSDEQAAQANCSASLYEPETENLDPNFARSFPTLSDLDAAPSEAPVQRWELWADRRGGGVVYDGPDEVRGETAVLAAANLVQRVAVAHGLISSGDGVLDALWMDSASGYPFVRGGQYYTVVRTGSVAAVFAQRSGRPSAAFDYVVALYDSGRPVVPCTAPVSEQECTECVEGGGGMACADVCEAGECRSCVASGGGEACLSRCGAGGVEASCRSCIEGGGGMACASACEEGQCRSCVASGGGEACLPRCRGERSYHCLMPDGTPVPPGTRRGPYTCMPDGTWG